MDISVNWHVNETAYSFPTIYRFEPSACSIIKTVVCLSTDVRVLLLRILRKMRVSIWFVRD
jgi:hypothetical protein